MPYRHIFFLAIVTVLSFFASYYAFRDVSLNSIGSNVFVANIDISGKTYDEAGQLVEEYYADVLKKPITIVYGGKEYQVPAEDLGAEFNIFKTVESTYLATSGETFLRGAANTFGSIFHEREIKPVIFIDEDKFKESIKKNIPGLENAKSLDLTLDQLRVSGKDFFAVIQQNLIDEKPTRVKVAAQFDEEVLEQEREERAELEDETVKEPSEKETPKEKKQIYVPQPFTFTYTNEQGQESKYIVRFSKDWLDYENPDEKGAYSNVLPEKLEGYIKKKISTQIDVESQNAYLKALPQPGSDYGTIEGRARDGQKVNVKKSVQTYFDEVKKESKTGQLAVERVKGKIINETGNKEVEDLELLSVGYSNFATSPAGRDFNVRKGLNEKVNAIVIPPGGEYNFNKNLGAVTNRNGWKNALAIFGGGRLAPVPGGGLCQVATTVYRAAVKGGFSIVEKNNHSLYVHYYVTGGDGLDAAIYPGIKNLRFKNDTGNWIVIQSYDEGYDAYVKIYGVPDGRKVDLFGPFYPSSIPDAYKDRIKLARNQIGWWQEIRDNEGNLTVAKQLTGTYRYLPKK